MPAAADAVLGEPPDLFCRLVTAACPVSSCREPEPEEAGLGAPAGHDGPTPSPVISRRQRSAHWRGGGPSRLEPGSRRDGRWLAGPVTRPPVRRQRAPPRSSQGLRRLAGRPLTPD